MAGGTETSEGCPSFSVRVGRRVPDLVESVKLKYLKLGYQYVMKHGMWCPVVMMMVMMVSIVSNEEHESLLGVCGLIVLSACVYLMSRPTCIYLMDFACYKPKDDLKTSKAELISLARQSGKFSEQSLEMQRRMVETSGIGDESYVPKGVISSGGSTATMKDGRAEASEVMFGAVDEVLRKANIRAKDIGVLVVNCSVFNPTPSLSAMIINHYKMRGNILSYNLGGMGCSAGVIAIDLARDMLHANPNNYALVVSTEMVGYNWYAGDNPSMLLPNCFLRMGCSAVVLSNRAQDCRRAKYRLDHVVRTHKGADDRSFRSVFQQEDERGIKGISIASGDQLMEIGAEAIKANMNTLGPLLLPLSEQLVGKVKRMIMNAASSSSSSSSSSQVSVKVDHICVHAAGSHVLDEVQRKLGLTHSQVEASRMTLHRFGNTSSSSIWYELAYLEAKARVKTGHRVWMLSFGSGFKCNSLIWTSLRPNTCSTAPNPWLHCLHRYPIPISS